MKQQEDSIIRLPHRMIALEQRQTSIETRQALTESSNASILNELVKVNAAIKESNVEIINIKLAVERIAASGKIVWIAATILVPAILAVVGVVSWAFETFQKVPH